MSQVLAIGGGGFTQTARYALQPGPLVEHALSLSGKDAPRVCGLFTATGDDADKKADDEDEEQRPETDIADIAAGEHSVTDDGKGDAKP